MSTFAGLTNALRSLNAQQYALAVTGDNMANANTPGYTRKRADLTEVGPVGGVSRLFATQSQTQGTVSADTASRLNDPVLDNRARVEHGQNSFAQASSGTISDVETVFNEPSNTGLSEQLNTFWNKWSNLANNNPTDVSLRNDVLQAGANVASSLNSAATELGIQLSSATIGLNSTASSIQATANQVATLNTQIKVGTASGDDVNSLSDTRDALLVKLAELSGATSSFAPDGTATVTLPGAPSGTPPTAGPPVTLVSGTTPAATVNVVAGPPQSITLTPSGGTVATAIGTTTGTLQANLNAVNTTIPAYQAKLDSIAIQLAAAVNNAQAAGYDQSATPVAGAAFFSAGATAATATTAANVTAANIKLAISNTLLIAASSVSSAGPNTDGANAATVAAIGRSTTGADALYRNLITTLGNAAQQATQAATVQQSVTSSVDTLQQSASGVNYDEETNNILIFQRAYQASARVLTTVDEMLDQLINHTGRVGL